MTRMQVFGAVLMAALPMLSHAQADIHDAFFSALRSEQGSYQGELKGDFGAFVRQKLSTTAPVYVAVSTVRAFKQKGCKRLRADITVPDLTWKDAKSGAINSFSYRYEMNLCPDGTPPMEAALETGNQTGVPVTPAKAQP